MGGSENRGNVPTIRVGGGVNTISKSRRIRTTQHPITLPPTIKPLHPSREAEALSHAKKKEARHAAERIMVAVAGAAADGTTTTTMRGGPRVPWHILSW